LSALNFPRLVLDTNVVVRGLANPDSVAGRILDACDRRTVVLLLCKPVVSEYRAILANPDVTERHPAITPQSAERALGRLRYVADWHAPVRVRFRFDRDHADEPFIELAIAGGATHLVTSDNDLLSLAYGYGEAAKRFRQRLPTAKVVDPGAFIREFGPGI
jgi:putative PIN family toxin of toxin-antitoxin system